MNPIAEHSWHQTIDNALSRLDADLAVVRILQGREREGLEYLDLLHSWLVRERREQGGALTSGTTSQLEPFLRVLGDAGLDDERRRFAALGAVPEPEAMAR